MLVRNSSARVAGSRRTSVPARAGRTSVKVACSAGAVTAWGAWDKYMSVRAGVTNQNAAEKKLGSDIGASISKSATTYKPRFTQQSDTSFSSFKLQHTQTKRQNGKDLPKDLHEKLETIGVAALKGALGHEGELDYANFSYSTTDINAALSITSTVLQNGSEKSAVLAFVATETERQASWSRLDGLILHWACTNGAGGAWTMPPEGWSVAPNKSRDAGGAWQCSFEKQVTGNNENMYVLVMQLPLRGALKSGGPVFVLKATAQGTDRWLKDANTDKDFFLDLQKLPVIKI